MAAVQAYDLEKNASFDEAKHEIEAALVYVPGDPTLTEALQRVRGEISTREADRQAALSMRREMERNLPSARVLAGGRLEIL